MIFKITNLDHGKVSFYKIPVKFNEFDHNNVNSK
jgi:hypothetical protein